MAKSSRNAAATNLQRLLNANTFKVNVPTEQDIDQATLKSDTVLSSYQASQGIDIAGDEKRIQYISLDFLLDNPYQPRKEIPIDEDLREMAEGIKTYDLLGAYPARKHPEREGYFQLGFGHRRREASRLAGKATMPIVLEDLDNSAMAGLAAVENIHRKDLTDLELGRLFLGMQNEGYTQEEIAESIKKKRGYIVNRLRLAESPVDIQAFIERKPDSLRAVAYLIKVNNKDDRALLIDRLATGKLTADDLAGDTSELVEMLREKINHLDEEDIFDKDAKSYTSLVNASHGEIVDPEILHSDMNRPVLTSSTTKQESGPENELPLVSESLIEGDQELEAVRIGSAKLRSVLRSYQAYLTSTMQRKSISRREQQLIHDIGESHELVLAKLHELSSGTP